MSNSSVYDKIIANALDEASRIKEEGNIKASNITEQVMNETNEKIKQVINDAKLKCDDAIKTKKAELEQAKKQNVLASQKAIISNTFNEVLNRLCTMSNEDLVKFVTTSLKKVKLEGHEEIMVNENDYVKYQQLFSSNHDNKLDKLLDNKYNLILSTTKANIKGGFIIASKYYDIDNSYEVLLDELKTKLEPEIAGKLFSKGE